MATTEAPEVTPEQNAANMEAYIAAYKEFTPTLTEYNQWKATGADIEARYEAALEPMKAAAAALGSDPMSVLKGIKGSRSTGERKPRDPERKKKVLAHFAQGFSTVAAAAEALGEDKSYITTMVSNAKKEGHVEQRGERPNTEYQYTGEVA